MPGDSSAQACEGYCSFQSVYMPRKKNKTDAAHLKEAMHLFGINEIKVDRSNILQIDFTT